MTLSRRSLQPRDLEPVVGALASEHELLELLLFTIGQQRELLEGPRAWLGVSVAQVAEAVDELRHLELIRAMAVSGLGLGDDPSLLEAAARAEPVPATVLRAHHQALVALCREVAEEAEITASLLSRRPPEDPDREAGLTALRQVVPRSLRDFLRNPDGTSPLDEDPPAAE